MKAIWEGSISFGLVNIPVSLYSAVEHHALKMRLLHKEKMSPIRYKRWCDDCKKEVSWKDIVKGLEVKRGRYVVLTKEELDSIKPGKSKRIEIEEFVDPGQLDPIFFESHYYAGPSKTGDKTYFLFLEALQSTGKVGIGRFVMRTKEYVCAVRPYGKGLLLSTLNYAYEIRDIAKVEDLKSKPKISKQELDLAEQLIDKITTKKFDLSDFEDTYAQALKKMVEKKLRGEKIVIIEPKVKKTPEKNLIEALKASL